MQPSDTQTLHKLPKRVYLEYIKLFPITQSPEVRTYTTLILTLIAIIGFSVFAISPTLKTIIELRKTRADNQFANQALKEKIAAMQSLQQQYGSLGSSLDRIDQAIPVTPDVPTLLAKIQTIARESGMEITKMESLEVELTKQGTEQTDARPSSFVFVVTVAGTYTELTRFLETVYTFDRITSIDSITIARETQPAGTITATIRAKAYFHPEVILKKGESGV